MKRFAVLGDPIEHSLSPEVHQQFAEQCGIVLCYERVRCVAGRLAEMAASLRDKGYSGLNITAPLKQEAFAWVDCLSDRARAAGAVNTIKFLEDGSSYGDNTDGAGLLLDLNAKLVKPLSQSCVLIVGAGGAVRGLLPELVAAQPANLTIVNRNKANARELAQRYPVVNIQVADYASLSGRFDLIVYSLPRGADVSLDIAARLVPTGICYDLNYEREGLTTWLQRCRDVGINDDRLYQGDGMLVAQAALGFELWHNVNPRCRYRHSREGGNPVLRSQRQN